MATKILDVKEYPQIDIGKFMRRYLEQHSPKYKFESRTKERAIAWQEKARAELIDVLGFNDIPECEFSPEIIEEVDRGDFLRQKLLIQSAPDKFLPLYLLKPKSMQGRLPVVLAFHGHGYGAKDIVGLWEDGRERYTPSGYQKDFAIELVRKGFLVAVPEMAGFGEHIPDQSDVDTRFVNKSSPCHFLSTWSMMLGGSAVGFRIFEAKRLLDYLAQLPEVDSSRIGAMGISGGGMHTFFLACVDFRIQTVVISGYFCSWFSSILAMNHCICNFVPGILKLGDLPDLAGLLAPRDVLIEAGTYDKIFPIESVRNAFERLKEIYSLWNASDRVELDEFEGRHQISGRRAYTFLQERLLK